MVRGLLDTSVFIAIGRRRRIDHSRLPDESAVSPVTLAELQVGVLVATEVESRAERISTFFKAGEFELLPVNEAVADCWALLRSKLAGSGRVIGINDLWIAATALANEIPVYTQDDDFDPLADIGGLTVVKI